MRRYALLLLCLFTVTGCSSTDENGLQKAEYQYRELPMMEEEPIGNQIPDWVTREERDDSFYILGKSGMEEFDEYAAEVFPTYCDAQWSQEQSDAVYLGRGMYCFALDEQPIENIFVYYPVILQGTIVTTLLIYQDVETQEFGSQMGPNFMNELNSLAQLTTKDVPAAIGFNNGNLIALAGTDYYVLSEEKMFRKEAEASEIP